LNILYGKIEHLKDNPYGTLIVEVISTQKEMEKFLEELSVNVYKVEVLK
jgi:D-methionine transport system ATP-binding protein